MVPAWIPWHLFWAYFIGACFLAAALSLVTRIQARLSASLLAFTFFLFVALMDVPACLQDPHNRFGITLALRELSFGSGPLALAASLSHKQHPRGAPIAATIARSFMAIAVLFYSFEQFAVRRSRPRCSAGDGDSHVALRACHLDLRGGRTVRNCGNPAARRKENPCGSGVDRLDCALCGIGRVRAHRMGRADQPRGPELSLRYFDVLRHSSPARGRHAAVRTVPVIHLHWTRTSTGEGGRRHSPRRFCGWDEVFRGGWGGGSRSTCRWIASSFGFGSCCPRSENPDLGHPAQAHVFCGLCGTAKEAAEKGRAARESRVQASRRG